MGTGSPGGPGGGQSGGVGSPGGNPDVELTGTGGTQVAGGAAGTTNYTPGYAGQPGSQFMGGNGEGNSSGWGGGGGGGWFGGGGGEANVPGGYATSGGGGSGYVGGPGVFGTTYASTSNTLTSTPQQPPYTNDPDYVAPAGVSTDGNSNGNPGLVVIRW